LRFTVFARDQGNKDCRSRVARDVRPGRATSRVRSSQDDAQGQPRGAAALHQPGDLVPVEAVTLAPQFGLFNLIYGAWMVVQGIELRRTGKTLHSAPSSWRERTAARASQRSS
jgi:hypothetical protein